MFPALLFGAAIWVVFAVRFQRAYWDWYRRAASTRRERSREEPLPTLLSDNIYHLRHPMRAMKEDFAIGRAFFRKDTDPDLEYWRDRAWRRARLLPLVALVPAAALGVLVLLGR